MTRLEFIRNHKRAATPNEVGGGVSEEEKEEFLRNQEVGVYLFVGGVQEQEGVAEVETPIN